MRKAREMKKRSLAYKIENAFCDAKRHSCAMVACGLGSVKPGHKKATRWTKLVLNQAAFAFGAAHGAAEDPERKGKQGRKEAQESDQRLRDFA